jgi:hypothetical protein
MLLMGVISKNMNVLAHCANTSLPVADILKCILPRQRHAPMHYSGQQTIMKVALADVPLDIDVEGGNEPIDTNFEPDNDVDDVVIPWDCIKAWDSMSEEELSSASDNNINTNDEEEDKPKYKTVNFF